MAGKSENEISVLVCEGRIRVVVVGVAVTIINVVSIAVVVVIANLVRANVCD